jgi:hypothetical protein
MPTPRTGGGYFGRWCVSCFGVGDANGVLKSAKDLPDGKKVLDPTTWAFDFESKSVEG